MAHDYTPVQIDQTQIDRAEQGWHTFTRYGKWMVLAVIAVLIFMAIFLV